MTQEKDAYQKKAEAEVKEWKAKMEQLRAKAEQAGAEAQIKKKETLNELESRWQVLQDKWQKVKKTNADAMKEMKKGFDYALKDLEDAFYSAQTKLQQDNEEV